MVEVLRSLVIGYKTLQPSDCYTKNGEFARYQLFLESFARKVKFAKNDLLIIKIEYQTKRIIQGGKRWL